MIAVAPIVILRSRAATEVAVAAKWYETEREGLGVQFLDALDSALQRISSAPHAGQVTHGRIRRAHMRRFPYAIFYLVEGEKITVLAVVHSRRSERNWPQSDQ